MLHGTKNKISKLRHKGTKKEQYLLASIVKLLYFKTYILMQNQFSYRFCLFFILLPFIFYSCNCHTEANGIVVDRITKQPLENVEVSIYLSMIHNDSLKIPVFTDKNGRYKVSHDYCSDYMIDFYKEGYIGWVASVKENDSIFLEVYVDDGK